MSRNTTEEIDFLCNCDRWHCGVIQSVLKQPKPGLVFNSGFQPNFDPGQCTGCEICVDRCPSGALKMGDKNVPVASLARCFGCATCAGGCEQEAIAMEPKPGFPEPPKTMKDAHGVWVLFRDENTGGDRQTVAEHIESLQFRYVLADGKEMDLPPNPKEIRGIRLMITARTQMEDPEMKGEDRFRRRTLTTYVDLRNTRDP